jgi:hypothetical protein
MVGGGFAGLCVAGRLHEAAIDDVRIVESGGDFGGVWYWNRYPGARCDTAAMVHLPLLEETGHMPTQKYPMAPEIWGHAKRIASPTATTGSSPSTSPKARGRCTVRSCLACPGSTASAGTRSTPPKWDDDYTGGSYEGAPMTKLADQRVGIIGTGATAAQCIPPLGRDANELYVFQRTPSAIYARNNHPIDPDWLATLQPGWQREWLMNFATLQGGGFADEDLVHEGWTDISQRIRDRMMELLDGDPSKMTVDSAQHACHDSADEKMEEIRARRGDRPDPATAEGEHVSGASRARGECLVPTSIKENRFVRSLSSSQKSPPGGAWRAPVSAAVAACCTFRGAWPARSSYTRPSLPHGMRTTGRQNPAPCRGRTAFRRSGIGGAASYVTSPLRGVGAGANSPPTLDSSTIVHASWRAQVWSVSGSRGAAAWHDAEGVGSRRRGSSG